MKPLIAPLLAAAVLGLGILSAPAALAAEHKVMLQVSDNDEGKWNLALNNAKNLQAAFGKDNVDIEIVVFGPGIGMLKAESTVGNRVQDAGTGGVKLIACENTMKAQKLQRDDMLDGIVYVPAGVAEITTRQKQGWAYIRP
jgi:intracellular sulfur oxidation DsrE/DsrF family protein